MNQVKPGISLPFLLIDFVLLNFTFFAINYWKRNTFALSSPYVKLLITFYFIWFFTSLFSKKFKIKYYENNVNVIRIYTKSIVFITYGVSCMVVLMGLTGFSRLHIYGTCLTLFLAEISLLSIYNVIIGRRRFIQSKGINSFIRTKTTFSTGSCSLLRYNYLC